MIVLNTLIKPQNNIGRYAIRNVRRVDELNFPNVNRKTVRANYADENKLFDSHGNFAWCLLSNILPVALIPITRDGYGLVGRRSKRGSSASKGRLTSGVAENIQRYLDEAKPDKLEYAVNKYLHPSDTARKEIDNNYQPRPGNVLSPILTAKRGIHEEVSTETARKIDFDQIKFLNIVWEMEQFHPTLCAVALLDYSLEQLMEEIRTYPGADHMEIIAWQPLRLSSQDKETLRVLEDWQAWAAGGLAAAITAVRYWESKHRT